MIIHIVKERQTLKSIADNYNVLKNDIISNNLHISDWKNLKPGMKIKIPLLNEETFDNLEETEPFIEDYYKKNEEVINEEVFEENLEEKEDINEVIEEKKEDIVKDIKENELNIERKEEDKEKEKKEKGKIDYENYYPDEYFRKLKMYQDYLRQYQNYYQYYYEYYKHLYGRRK